MNIVVFSYNRRHKIKAIPLNYFFTYNKNPYRYFKTASSSRLAHWTHLYSIDGQIYPKSFVVTECLNRKFMEGYRVADDQAGDRRAK